jgi:hypothetical protein
MNKKDVAQLRKEFKENSISLKFQELYSVYLKKDDCTTIHKKVEFFDSMDIEKKELYFNNFKKILSTSIDTKLFQLEFDKTVVEGNSQRSLYDAVAAKDKMGFEESLDTIMGRILSNYKYETDVMVNFLKGEYYKGNKNRNVEADEAIDDVVQSFEFVICSVNKIEFPKKALIFDFYKKDFTPNSALEAIVNLNSPLEGFIFPDLDNGYSNVNKVMYYCSKPKELNVFFIEDVLNCSTKFTAEDEKECFHNILATVVGEKIKPEIIQDIYTKISEKSIEDETNETIGFKDVRRILEEAGVDEIDGLNDAFEQTCGIDYDFKIDNIIPDFKSKSIKISNDTADITITPSSLSSVRQVLDEEGRKCLLIEINDDIIINGLKLETEEMTK